MKRRGSVTDRDAEYKVSVCTGALILGAAGFLDGKRATTNPSAYDLLAPYCKEVIKERFVRKDGLSMLYFEKIKITLRYRETY